MYNHWRAESGVVGRCEYQSYNLNLVGLFLPFFTPLTCENLWQNPENTFFMNICRFMTIAKRSCMFSLNKLLAFYI